MSHGVYVTREDERSVTATFAAVRSVLPPEGIAAHLTAALLYGLWLPRLPSCLPCLAGLPPAVDRPERAGLYVFRSRAGLPPPHFVAGVPCVAPEVCIGQLAEDLGVLDLVVVIDSALSRKLCTVADVEGCIRSRQRGLPKLRQALRLCDERSESPWETILRVLHVASGIPVEPQHKLVDGRGAVAARGDLWIIGTKRLSEYDGADHRSREQQQRDLARDKMLQRLGYERYGYIAREITSGPTQIILDAERALGWPHSSNRLAGWWPLADGSCLTEGGRRRLLHRLHRFARPLRGRGERRPTSPELRETG